MISAMPIVFEKVLVSTISAPLQNRRHEQLLSLEVVSQKTNRCSLYGKSLKRSPEILFGEIVALQHGSHCSIEHKYVFLIASLIDCHCSVLFSRRHYRPKLRFNFLQKFTITLLALMVASFFYAEFGSE
jgi:hypothetical protein